MQLLTLIIVIFVCSPAWGQSVTSAEDSKKRKNYKPEVINPNAPIAETSTRQDSRALLGNDIYFAPGGGIRTRYFNLFSGTGGGFTERESLSQIRNRFQLDMKLHKGEFFEVFGRFLHVGTWGRQSSANNMDYLDSPAMRDDFSANNGVYMSQAWGLWKVADVLGIRFGRGPINIGRGLLYGENDWFDIPNTFDHFAAMFDWRSVKLNIIGAKLEELQYASGQTPPDPEENHYIAEVNITDTADWIKLLNIHFAQINRDIGSADAGTNFLTGLNMQRVGLDFVFQSKSFVGEAYLGVVNGKQTGSIAGSIGQSVIDFKLSYRKVEWSNMNIYGLAHIDTGDNNTNDGADRHYDSLYYDVYGRSGMMDFIRWGNLTMFSFGFDIEASAGLTLGMSYWKFSKTKDSDTPEFGQGASFITERINAGQITLAPDNEVGDEIDIYATWNWPSGVSAGVTMSSFKPGSTFSQATTSTGDSINKNIFQIISEVKFFF